MAGCPVEFKVATILLAILALLPIPVFYDLETKKVLVDSVPKELREELKDLTFEA